MRVAARPWAAAALACAVGSLAGATRAQPPVAGGPAAEPSTHAAMDAGAGWSRTDAWDGAWWAAGARGGWAVHPALELGAGLGVAGHHLEARGAARAAGRFGATPLLMWAGSGLRRGELGLGARVIGELGAHAVGLEQVGAGGADGALRLRLDATHAGRWHEARLGAEAGLAWRGARSWIGGGDARLAAGPERWPARPLLGLRVDLAEHLRPSVRGELGLWLPLARAWHLRAALLFAGPRDPTGARLGASATLVWSASGVD